MIWTHKCGWRGELSDLKEEYYQGILIGHVCPKCGELWPFDE